jgi:hypothetical protein
MSELASESFDTGLRECARLAICPTGGQLRTAASEAVA